MKYFHRFKERLIPLASIKALIIKEILAVWRDKKSRIVLIGPPLIQLIILSHSLLSYEYRTAIIKLYR